MRALPTALALVTALAVAAPALADEAPPPPPPPSASEPPPPDAYGKAPPDDEGDAPGEPGVRMQDGFYASLGLGGGYFADDFEQTFGIFRNVDGTAKGASGSFQLAIGGALKPGLILGGAVVGEQVADPKISVEGLDVSQTDDISLGTLVVVGPFIDWYFTPGDGLHLMGLLGGANITVRDDTGAKDADRSPAGGGGMVGLGYNFWVADQWSVGVLGRVTSALLQGDNLTHRASAGALLVTGTYN